LRLIEWLVGWLLLKWQWDFYIQAATYNLWVLICFASCLIVGCSNL
jgi:hypothetical protein